MCIIWNTRGFVWKLKKFSDDHHCKAFWTNWKTQFTNCFYSAFLITVGLHKVSKRNANIEILVRDHTQHTFHLSELVLKEPKRWKEAQEPSYKWPEPVIKHKLLYVISSIQAANQNIYFFLFSESMNRKLDSGWENVNMVSWVTLVTLSVRKSEKKGTKQNQKEKNEGKHSRSPTLFSLRAAKHFFVQCCSTIIAQTNFTRGINMAEILGFYELLHSAGGRVKGVMCSAWLDLNSPDIEKGWNKFTREEQRGAQRLYYYNYCYHHYWLLHQYSAGAHVHSI